MYCNVLVQYCTYTVHTCHQQPTTHTLLSPPVISNGQYVDSTMLMLYVGQSSMYVPTYLLYLYIIYIHTGWKNTNKYIQYGVL